MKKSELKTGMVVEMRCGDEAVVMLDMMGVSDRFVSLGGGFYPMQFYCDDLMSDNHTTEFDIMKVSSTPTHKIDFRNKDILWERKEVREYTMEELTKKLGFEFKIKRNV